MHFFICALSTLLSNTASALIVRLFPGVPIIEYEPGQLARHGFSAASAAIVEPLVKAIRRGWDFTMLSLVSVLSCSGCVIISRRKIMGLRRKRDMVLSVFHSL
jgi:hypothetical protein